MQIAKQVATFLIICSASALCYFVQARADWSNDRPQLMLWAWERPENLQWINPKKVGVAVLVRTILLSRNLVTVHKRQQPLKVPPDTYIMAVVRLESDPNHLPNFSESQVDEIVNEILQGSSGVFIRAVQIDFDARANERQAYSEILAKVRQKLPPNMGLSMTALASWCAADYWLEKLPVDEVVPMVFRMGVDSAGRSQYISYLSSEFSRSRRRCKCQNSIGIATDEFVNKRVIDNKRVYIFSPHPWVSQQVVSSIDLSRYK